MESEQFIDYEIAKRFPKTKCIEMVCRFFFFFFFLKAVKNTIPTQTQTPAHLFALIARMTSASNAVVSINYNKHTVGRT